MVNFSGFYFNLSWSGFILTSLREIILSNLFFSLRFKWLFQLDPWVFFFYFVCLFVGGGLCVGFLFRIISVLFLLCCCFLSDLLTVIMLRLSLFGYALFKRPFLEICLLEQHTNKTTVLLLTMCKIFQSIYYFWYFSVLALALVLKWIYSFLSTLRYSILSSF